MSKKTYEKEHVLPYAKTRKNAVSICAVLVFLALLTGCGFTKQETPAVTDDVKPDISIEMEEAQIDAQEVQDTDVLWDDQADDNNIYNAVKYYNDYFYFSDADGFKRMSKDQSITENLAEGNVRLGNCDGNYIYYIRYSTDAPENAGIFRMDLSKLTEEKMMEWSESMWGIYNIYAYQNILYFEGSNLCEAYEITDGEVNKIDESDNILYQQLDRCGISHEDINTLAFGYINMVFQYHKLVCLDRENNKIVVWDTDSGEVINRIEQCGSDILMGERGIVYRDLENNIWLKAWGQEESNCLYDMSEYDNQFVNYGTFDDQYIYGFYENEEACTLVKVKWEGGCETGRTFENTRMALELEFSANNGVISFVQDGHRIFEDN